MGFIKMLLYEWVDPAIAAVISFAHSAFRVVTDSCSHFPQVTSVIKNSPKKKAAANAAAKVRRWIKELQINVSAHRVKSRKPSTPLNVVAASHRVATGFQAVLVKARQE
jgi:hypothetical protein